LESTVFTFEMAPPDDTSTGADQFQDARSSTSRRGGNFALASMLLILYYKIRRVVTKDE